MRTDDLVTMLARGGAPADSHAVARRYAVGLSAGAGVALLLVTMVLGVRPDLASAMRLPMFWIKFGYVAALAAASVMLALRLSRPGERVGWTPMALAAPVIAMWVLAFVAVERGGGQEFASQFFGRTWRSCPLLIAGLSIPLFVAMLWVMRGMAPTRLRAAGAVAGLVAGTGAALVYALHCPELGPPFLGFWYVLGMLVPTATGALLGPRLLRW
ncbi:MAG: DUF1109 domain-containing protein [Betaproteobacteria bacterium]